MKEATLWIMRKNGPHLILRKKRLSQQALSIQEGSRGRTSLTRASGNPKKEL